MRNHGALVRGALWLVQEVGVGGTFTKRELRDAFPGVSQIDRRIRELRDYGWTIRSSVEDVSLRSDQQKLVAVGAPVWEHGSRSQYKKSSVTSRERAAALAEAAYMCEHCGISGGEPYPDKASETAVLGVFRTDDSLVVLCKWCRRGSPPPDAPTSGTPTSRVTSRVLSLSDQDLKRLAFWLRQGRRLPTPGDHVWMAIRHLGSEEKSKVEMLLEREIANR